MNIYRQWQRQCKIDWLDQEERQHSLKSGFKPILYNKLGDIAYLYSASLVFDLVKTIDLELVKLLMPWFRY